MSDIRDLPPAGGEVEVYKAGVHFPGKYLSYTKDVVLLEDYRAHVTKLQAENESLREKIKELVNSHG